MYNEQLVNKVREGKVAIYFTSEDANLIQELTNYIKPLNFELSGLIGYYFLHHNGWEYKMDLPPNMDEIPFEDFLKVEQDNADILRKMVHDQRSRSSANLEAERRRFWCGVVVNMAGSLSIQEDVLKNADEALKAFDERFGK